MNAQVKRPAGHKYPTSFYRRVSSTYSRLVRSGELHPCKVIADESGIPVKTVHRWVAQARSMKLLPKGQQGRVG